MTKVVETEELRRMAPGIRALLIGGASAFAMSLAAPAFAQDEGDASDVDVIEEEEDEADASDDKVVVTGSRVRRDTFSSISPLQVITAEDSLDVGLIDPAQILQQSEAASGQQIDATFQGFVLDNGPGSQTLNLRGLGADRTLLLINGRRMAPAGVEGAPSNPSINLIPGSLIDRYDLLLDGASSVYGSDAVAGVGNVILKKDFEGFEVFASGDYNMAGAGHDYTLSAAWGKNTDRGFIGIGAEYDFRDEVTFSDRKFLSGCDANYEITEDGEIRTLGIADKIDYENSTGGAVTTSTSPCKPFVGVNALVLPYQTYGSVFYTDGPGNSGIPNWNRSFVGGLPVDADGDGLADVDYYEYDLDLEPSRSLISEQKRISVMSYGEYTFEGDWNITPFYEALYVTADISGDSGNSQVAAAVPYHNPFNPCNFPGAYDPLSGLPMDPSLANPNGVDCAYAETTLLGRPGANSFYALPVRPFVSIAGDRENFDVTQEQTRIVGGVRSDLPFMNVGTLSDWAFEFSGVYSRAKGTSDRFGVREDRLAASLGYDPTVDSNGNGIADDYNSTNYFGAILDAPCDFTNVTNPNLLTQDVVDNCVPVNLFAPSLIGAAPGAGEFATQAERDYLFDSRSFETIYEQTLFNAFISGTIYELPAGEVGLVIGGEWRRDEIDSQPNDVAANGLFFGFSADQGATGSKDIKEAFFELDVPLIAGKPLIRQLDVNASARFTDEEFYGSAWTYSLKGGWRPFDSLLLKSSFGTSFRAPNLRENFLAGQTGFNNGLFDPCAVPNDAYDETTGTYIASQDTREATTLQNCIREGRDPTTVGVNPTLMNTIQSTSAEVSSGGSLDLKEETSESFTAGFAFEQPWFESFDLNVNVNYYDIEIEDSVTEPSSQFIVNDCFTRDDGTRSVFCDRISYMGDRDMIDFIEAGFINQDKDTVAGLDYNIAFNKEFTAFDQPMDFGINLRANQLKERSQIFVNDNGTISQEEYAGEFGFPEWTGTGTFTLDVSDYRFTWQTRYIGDVSQDEDAVDEFSDALDSQGTGFFGDTCAGPDYGDVLCRDVGFADGWYEHAASIRYSGDTWVIRAGITNIFNEAPPKVDSNEVFAISNTPIGNGYNLDGREYFVTISKDFN